ncbi:MAG TPA: hypothetical protein VHG91_14770 [Longimicrobium sp.]|nr:hypothetical protein [Longimicrobium sp.]
MRIPPAGTFLQEPFRTDAGHWRAPVDGDGTGLRVPDGDGAPDAASLALAERALPEAGALVEEARAYLAGTVDFARASLHGDPEVIGVTCDALSATVTLELNWDSDLYSLWHVRFRWRPDGGRTPIAFGRRDWEPE